MEKIDQSLATDVANAQERRVREQLHDRADALRRMADQIDREADKTLSTGGPFRAMPLATIVSQAIHTVTWGVANLGLDNLASAAAESDVYRGIAHRLAQEEQS